MALSLPPPSPQPKRGSNEQLPLSLSSSLPPLFPSPYLSLLNPLGEPVESICIELAMHKIDSGGGADSKPTPRPGLGRIFPMGQKACKARQRTHKIQNLISHHGPLPPPRPSRALFISNLHKNKGLGGRRRRRKRGGHGIPTLGGMHMKGSRDPARHTQTHV